MLNPLAERGKITRFLDNVRDGEILRGLAEDIRDAMTEYQVCIPSIFALTAFEVVPRLRCSKTFIKGGFSSL